MNFMKAVVILILAVLSSGCPDGCDCTIAPFKSSCFEQCVTKVLAQASYGELTGKYGLPQDTARKIISARERGAPLDASTRSTATAILKQEKRRAHDGPNG